MNRFVCSLAISLATVVALSAQEGTSPLMFHMGMGFVQGVGRTGTNLDTGWMTSGGAGYNFNRFVGANVDITTSVLGNATSVPSFYGVSGGHLLVFAATLDPVVHLNPNGHVDIYVTGGGGLFRRAFSPAASFGGPLISGYSVNKPGTDIGVGLAFGSKWHGKFYAEARYDHIFDNNHLFTNFLPVAFGYRW